MLVFELETCMFSEKMRIRFFVTKHQVTFRGQLFSKFSFWEVYHRIYGWKSSLMATPERSCKT